MYECTVKANTKKINTLSQVQASVKQVMITPPRQNKKKIIYKVRLWFNRVLYTGKKKKPGKTVYYWKFLVQPRGVAEGKLNLLIL